MPIQAQYNMYNPTGTRPHAAGCQLEQVTQPAARSPMPQRCTPADTYDVPARLTGRTYILYGVTQRCNTRELPEK